MKPNKLTPGENLRWEANRMMLPEHKERLIQHRKEQNKKERPIFDEQFQRLIGYAVNQSVEQNTLINVTVFGEYEDIIYTGKISKIDLQLRKIKLENEDGSEWIRIDDIILIDAV